MSIYFFAKKGAEVNPIDRMGNTPTEVIHKLEPLKIPKILPFVYNADLTHVSHIFTNLMILQHSSSSSIPLLPCIFYNFCMRYEVSIFPLSNSEYVARMLRGMARLQQWHCLKLMVACWQQIPALKQ